MSSRIMPNRSVSECLSKLLSKFFGLLTFLFCIGYGFPSEAFYPRNKISRLPLHVMSLYTPKILRSVLSEEQLKKKCPKGLFPSALKSCKQGAKKKYARILDIPVFERPTFQSQQYGVIRITSVPLKELSFTFITNDKGEKTQFTPDIVCKHTKSDCVAEHTVLDKKGNWIMLPEDPFPGAVWINFFYYTRIEPRIRSVVRLGRLFTVGRSVRATKVPQGKNEFIYSGTEIFIKRIEKDRLMVRLALPGDKICKPKDDHPFGEGPQEYAIYLAELYNGKGQLRMSPTYPNYCPQFKDE